MRLPVVEFACNDCFSPCRPTRRPILHCRADLLRLARAEYAVEVMPESTATRCESSGFSWPKQVQRQEPIYGVTTGFGNNADRLLGAHRARDELPGGNPQCNDMTLLEELQHNLGRDPRAVCVGDPFAAEVVRAMLAIRINTLLRGHSGIRPSTLQSLAEMLNRGVVPVVPQKGSVGASGDLAPVSTWPSCCSVVVRPSSMASACPVPTHWPRSV